ncbi:MAG: hypothetical protein IKK21_01580 [Clostridia bacterium]|nr:hypothetical protein [Clostridia bacterium]
MQTRTPVNSPAQRRAFRQDAQRRGQMAAVRTIAAASLLRAGAGYLLPRTGAAGWWLLLVCILPALLVYFTGWLALRRTGAATLRDAVQRLLGAWTVRLLGWAEAICLAAEGAACLTMLVTLLDEGVGIAVSPVVLAAFTAAGLAWCIPGDGLARSVQLLRWAVLPLFVLILANLLPLAKVDHLFPVMGRGAAQSAYAAMPCLSAGWPLLLLLEIPPAETGRCTRGWCSAMLLPPLLLAVTLAIPHEILILHTGLAAALMLPGSFLSPLNRTLLMCLWMLLAALCTVLCAKGAATAAVHRAAPGAFLLLAGFAALQLLGAEAAVHLLRQAQTWLPLGLAVMVTLTAGASFIKRRKR